MYGRRRSNLRKTSFGEGKRRRGGGGRKTKRGRGGGRYLARCQRDTADPPEGGARRVCEVSSLTPLGGWGGKRRGGAKKKRGGG